MPRRLLVLFVAASWALAPVAVAAQDSAPTDCGTYRGVVCDGWVTDSAGVLDDEPRLEDATGRIVARYDRQTRPTVLACG